MNSLRLHRLVKVAPLAMAAFSIVLFAHGVPAFHAILNGDRIGNIGPN
jgi:hypothetical protein